MASTEVLKQKEAQVSALAEEMKSAKIILLTDYRGITVDDVTTLRKDLRQTNANYKVIKNNIIKRALEANGESGLDDILEGPTAILMGNEDYLSPLKAIYAFTKSHDFYKIKGGIVEGKVMSVEDLITLAKLPSREELLSKLAGALLGTISKVAIALDQVQKQKEAGAPAAEPVKEEKEETKVEAKEEVKEEASEAKVEEKPAEETTENA